MGSDDCNTKSQLSDSSVLRKGLGSLVLSTPWSALSLSGPIGELPESGFPLMLLCPCAFVAH